MTMRGKAGVYAAAALLRLILFHAFPSLPDLLTGRVEVSTPVSSFKRRESPRLRAHSPIPSGAVRLTSAFAVQEGLFLYNHNVWPYDGGVYHQAPLLLPLFSLLPDTKAWPAFTSLLYVLVDLLTADELIKIAESGEAGQSRLFSSPRREKRASSLAVAAA